MSVFSSILDEALEAWQGIRQHLVEEVENIPEDQLDFRLTPSSRSVREIVQHLLEAGEVMTGELCRPDTDFHRESWAEMAKRYVRPVSGSETREELVGLLKSSFEESQTKFRELGEIMMLQLITRFDGKQGTRLAWFHHGIAHEMYHTGQLTAYTRALGGVPALTQKIG